MSVGRVLAGVGVALAALVGAGVWYAYDQDERYRADQNGVVMSVRFADTGECADGLPLLVRVENRTTRTVKEIDYELALYEPGRSDNLHDILDSARTWKFIVAPHDSESACVAIGRLRGPAQKLTPRAMRRLVTFYQPGEFIPVAPPR